MERLRLAHLRDMSTAWDDYLPVLFDALNQNVGLSDRDDLVVLSPDRQNGGCDLTELLVDGASLDLKPTRLILDHGEIAP